MALQQRGDLVTGLDRPYVHCRHYARFGGEVALVPLHGGTEPSQKWQGIIKAVNGEMIANHSRRQKDEVFALSNIQKANFGSPHNSLDEGEKPAMNKEILAVVEAVSQRKSAATRKNFWRWKVRWRRWQKI